MHLYYSPYCPYAQRPRAVCARLGLEPELHEIDLADRGAAYLALCPTGRVPLLDDDGLLYESSVICDYLAAKAGWTEAWGEDLFLEHRQRLALAQWDGSVAPAFYRSMREPGTVADESLDKELDFFEQTLELIEHRSDNLLGLCCAPNWIRFQWMSERSELAEYLGRRPGLRRWLEAAAARPEIQDTLPDREDMVARLMAKFAAPAG